MPDGTPTTSRTRETTSSTAKGDGRREAILATLGELLSTQCFADITIADITEHAGITRPGFYFYFPSKAAAVAALLAEVTDDLLALASSWYEGRPGSPEAHLREGMRATIADWRLDAALFTAVLDAAAADAGAVGLWTESIQRFIDRVAVRIELDTGRAPVPRRPSARALATGLVHMTFALMELDIRDLLAGGDGVPELENTLVHTWYQAIYGDTT